MKETELAQKFINSLSDIYDLYFEVGTMDIVGKQGNIVTAIEVKKQLNFKVIEQAYYNIPNANYSYIAVPQQYKQNNFAYTICETFGIGVLLYNEDYDSVYERIKPKLNRKQNPNEHLLQIRLGFHQ